MRLHAEFQSLDALYKEERVEGADAGTEIAQAFHAYFDDPRQRPKDLGEDHAVITGARLGNGWIFVGPRKLAAIHDDAADRRTVAAQELRRRVHDDIGAVL